jgi:pimeloyl-ACP methyl ester carboxylesterase
LERLKHIALKFVITKLIIDIMPAQSSINLFDQFAAQFLMLITPEYAIIKQARQNTKTQVNGSDFPLIIQPAYIDVEGIKIRYAHGGKAQGETILLLNPLPQSILAFNPIWSILTAQFNVFAVDLPGFGKSEGGLEFMTFQAQGEFLKQIIDALGIKSPHIIGPDIGMPTALMYAISHQNEVKSVLIGDGPAIASGKNGSIINKMVGSSFWRFILSISSGAFVEGGNYLGYINYIPTVEEVNDYVESYKGRLGIIGQWFADYPKSIATLSPYLGNLHLPVKIFWGRQDQFLLVENTELIQTAIPNSEVHIFENCGHFSYQDQAEQFAEMVTNWVNSFSD